jgi:carbonic anhydrase/acetyltransferase-like protein (isoleucine patch superfamily)
LLRPIVAFAATRIFYAMGRAACKCKDRRWYADDMASRTIVDSVPRVAGPPANGEALEEQLDMLRDRFPGAIFQRYLDKIPTLGAFVHVAPGAVVVGDVELRDDVSIWYGCVLRGDVNRIEIHERSNIQDGSVVHLGDLDPTIVGEEVVVGHRAVLHGCRIEGGCLIGIQATVLDGVVIGHGSVIGSGALVPPGTRIPPHSLVLGVPGKVVKTLTALDEEFHRRLAGKYIRLAHNYREG